MDTKTLLKRLSTCKSKVERDQWVAQAIEAQVPLHQIESCLDYVDMQESCKVQQPQASPGTPGIANGSLGTSPNS